MSNLLNQAPIYLISCALDAETIKVTFNNDDNDGVEDDDDDT